MDDIDLMRMQRNDKAAERDQLNAEIAELDAEIARIKTRQPLALIAVRRFTGSDMVFYLRPEFTDFGTSEIQRDIGALDAPIELPLGPTYLLNLSLPGLRFAAQQPVPRG